MFRSLVRVLVWLGKHLTLFDAQRRDNCFGRWAVRLKGPLTLCRTLWSSILGMEARGSRLGSSHGANTRTLLGIG